MIPIKPAIKARLLEDEALKAFVAGRIYPDQMPARAIDKFPGPTVVFITWPITAFQHSEGAAGLEAHRVQVDAYALDPETPDVVMAAVADALMPAPPASPRWTVGNVEVQAVRETPSAGSPTHEDDTNLFRRSLDFKVHVGRAA